MKLGDLFYTKVKNGKVICFQLYRIFNIQKLRTVSAEPITDISYSFRRINPNTMKSLGNCIDNINFKQAMTKFEPLTEAIKILYMKENL